MVSLTLKVILDVAKNDAKCRDVLAPLSEQFSEDTVIYLLSAVRLHLPLILVFDGHDDGECTQGGHWTSSQYSK